MEKQITKEQIERRIIEVARELNKTTDPYQMGRIDGKLCMLYEQLDFVAPLVEFKTRTPTGDNPLMMVCSSANLCPSKKPARIA